MKEAFKDTIFTDKSAADNDYDDPERFNFNDRPVEAYHKEDFEIVKPTETIQNLPASKSKITPVKLRHENRDLDHNFKQKIFRRLSFSAKEKLKVAPKIVKEDGDHGFEIITVPVLDLLEPTKKVHSPAVSKTTFSVFLSTLQRRGSKRDSTAKGN